MREVARMMVREEQRLAALCALTALNRQPEERFDRIARTAALALSAPVAAISFIDAEREWLKAAEGLALGEVPRAGSPGDEALRGDEPLVVEDLRADARFAGCAWASEPTAARFYAGQVVRAADGSRLGVLAVMDRRPRTLDDRQRRALVDLARLVEGELEGAATPLEEAVAGASAVDLGRLRKLERFFDLSRDMLGITDGERFLELSPSWARALGYSREELMRMPITALSAGDAAGARRDVRISNGDSGFIARVRCRDGSLRALEWIVAPDRTEGVMYAVARDVTDKLRIADALRASEERHRLLFATMSEGVVMLDERGAALAANPSAELLLATPAEDLVLQKLYRECFRWVREDGSPLPEAEHPASLGPERVRDFVCGLHAPDGVLRWLSMNSAPLHDPRTGARGAVLSLHDVTARREAEGERERVKRLKDEFIATVSHELRTPLASARGALGLLAGGVAGALPESARSIVEIALHNVERLGDLVEDVLDMDSLDACRMKFRLAPASVAALFEQASADGEAKARDREVRLVLRHDPGLSVLVDAERFRQVMHHLVSNAVKFSPRGGAVEITARASSARVRVEVRDEGSGIPEDFRARVFERFSQADGSDRRAHGGAGLGLALAKGLLAGMGSAIDFVSEAGRGTTFFFEIERADLAGAPDA